MCYRGEANSLRLCDECLANSRALSVNCWSFNGNSQTIHLDVDVHNSFNSLGTGCIRCLGECRTMYKCTTSNIRIVFTCRIRVLPKKKRKPQIISHWGVFPFFHFYFPQFRRFLNVYFKNNHGRYTFTYMSGFRLNFFPL